MTVIAAEIIDRVRELNSTITIKEATLADDKKFVTLFNKHYKKASSVEYYRWQFFENTEDSKLFLAIENEVVVAMYGIKFRLLSIDIKSAFVIDFLVDEHFRKRGLGILLQIRAEKYCIENNVFLMTALPNSFGKGALLSLGWNLISKIDKLIWEKNAPENSHSVLNGLAKDNELIHFVKDEAFEIWRYCNNPIYTYEKFGKRETNRLITKIFWDQDRQTSSLDIVSAIFDDEFEGHSLIQMLVARCRTGEVHLVTAWAFKHTSTYELLVAEGFVPEAQERYFCLKKLKEIVPEVDNERNWHIQAIDAEIF